MKPKHTPGPWATTSTPEGNMTAVYSVDGVICRMRATENALSNASLISLAPELLTWTKELLAHIERTQPDGFEGVKEHVRSLISRAEGGK